MVIPSTGEWCPFLFAKAHSFYSALKGKLIRRDIQLYRYFVLRAQKIDVCVVFLLFLLIRDIATSTEHIQYTLRPVIKTTHLLSPMESMRTMHTAKNGFCEMSISRTGR